MSSRQKSFKRQMYDNICFSIHFRFHLIFYFIYSLWYFGTFWNSSFCYCCCCWTQFVTHQNVNIILRLLRCRSSTSIVWFLFPHFVSASCAVFFLLVLLFSFFGFHLNFINEALHNTNSKTINVNKNGNDKNVDGCENWTSRLITKHSQTHTASASHFAIFG